jgi:hypothetical protein
MMRTPSADSPASMTAERTGECCFSWGGADGDGAECDGPDWGDGAGWGDWVWVWADGDWAERDGAD